MPKFRGITMSLVSQFGVLTIPEFSPQPSPPPSDPFSPESLEPALLDDANSTVSVYVPMYHSSMFWISYEIVDPKQVTMFYFKLYQNNKNIISWGCTEKNDFRGKMMFALHDDGRGEGRVERRALTFAPADDVHNERAKDKGHIEVRVYRARGRRRIAPEFVTYDASSTDSPTPRPGKPGKPVTFTSAGYLPRRHPISNFEYALLDPVALPFITFRWLPRDWFELERLGVTEVPQSEESSCCSSQSRTTSASPSSDDEKYSPKSTRNTPSKREQVHLKRDSTPRHYLTHHPSTPIVLSASRIPGPHTAIASTSPSILRIPPLKLPDSPPPTQSTLPPSPTLSVRRAEKFTLAKKPSFYLNENVSFSSTNSSPTPAPRARWLNPGPFNPARETRPEPTRTLAPQPLIDDTNRRAPLKSTVAGIVGRKLPDLPNPALNPPDLSVPRPAGPRPREYSSTRQKPPSPSYLDSSTAPERSSSRLHPPRTHSAVHGGKLVKKTPETAKRAPEKGAESQEGENEGSERGTKTARRAERESTSGPGSPAQDRRADCPLKTALRKPLGPKPRPKYRGFPLIAPTPLSEKSSNKMVKAASGVASGPELAAGPGSNLSLGLSSNGSQSSVGFAADGRGDGDGKDGERRGHRRGKLSIRALREAVGSIRRK